MSRSWALIAAALLAGGCRMCSDCCDCSPPVLEGPYAGGGYGYAAPPLVSSPGSEGETLAQRDEVSPTPGDESDAAAAAAPLAPAESTSDLAESTAAVDALRGSDDAVHAAEDLLANPAANDAPVR